MTENKKPSLRVQPFKVFRPLISGLLLNAYYSSLNLKKASGVEITEDVLKETILEIYEIYGRIDEHLAKLLTKPAPSQGDSKTPQE